VRGGKPRERTTCKGPWGRTQKKSETRSGKKTNTASGRNNVDDFRRGGGGGGGEKKKASELDKLVEEVPGRKTAQSTKN